VAEKTKIKRNLLPIGTRFIIKGDKFYRDKVLVVTDILKHSIGVEDENEKIADISSKMKYGIMHGAIDRYIELDLLQVLEPGDIPNWGEYVKRKRPTQK